MGSVRAELPCRHVPDVRRVRVCRQHDDPLCRWRCIPAFHDPNVRRDGSELGLHPHWWRCPPSGPYALHLLQVWPTDTSEKPVRPLHGAFLLLSEPVFFQSANLDRSQDLKLAKQLEAERREAQEIGVA
jgi:hypothetical protein